MFSVAHTCRAALLLVHEETLSMCELGDWFPHWGVPGVPGLGTHSVHGDAGTPCEEPLLPSNTGRAERRLGTPGRRATRRSRQQPPWGCRARRRAPPGARRVAGAEQHLPPRSGSVVRSCYLSRENNFCLKLLTHKTIVREQRQVIKTPQWCRLNTQ